MVHLSIKVWNIGVRVKGVATKNRHGFLLLVQALELGYTAGNLRRMQDVNGSDCERPNIRE